MIEKCGNPSGYGCCVLYKADKSYFLQSEPTTYTVTYDANGGYSAPASQTKVEGQALKLASAIKAYFAGGGKHVQFIVEDQETLLDAKEHPQEHADLMVRVAGYSAYFIQLTPGLQDEVIARTENRQVR